MGAFNELWYRKAPARHCDELQSIPQFFHPLDMIDRWNRMYGPRGFLQWQYVVPFGAEDLVRQTAIERLERAARLPLVRGRAQDGFGPANPGAAVVPASGGWTRMALDIPHGHAGPGAAARRAGPAGHRRRRGRIFTGLAKDSRMRPELAAG